ncbi:MAG: hypothetical protein J5809_02700 [Selenomonadaceae bacterium]|nr:hypothetical protein [Selenomonadaceae bacterium]
MTIKKVPVKVAAALMGKSEQYVRCGLQYERLKFGAAVTTNPNKPRPSYTYHISPKLFMEYTGYTLDEIISAAEKLGVNISVED